MFQGTTPKDAQEIFQEVVESWGVDEIYIGCSGNFTIERVLYNAGFENLHSNDVSIYSCILGRYFSGKPLRIRPREDADERYVFMLSRFETDEEKVASVLLMSKYQQMMWKEAEYYKEQLEELKIQWDALIDETAEKIKNVKFNIKDFYEGDVREFINKVDDNSGIVCFPPFWTGGYEKMWSNIEKMIEWEPPEYDLLGDEGVWEFFDQIMQKKHWAFGSAYENEKLEEYLVGKCQTTNRGKEIYIYASSGPKRIVTPNQNVADVGIDRLGSNEKIGEQIDIKVLPLKKFNALRAECLNPSIKVASVQYAFAVTVDEKLVGCIALGKGSYDVNIDMPYMYLLSDFAINGTKYPRLSKLIVMCSLSKEIRQYCEMKTGARLRTIFTTAFTKKHESMKYRGILEKYNETKTEDGNQINYWGRMGTYSMAECLKEWKEKYGGVDVKN